jgi:hypothetical protein
MACCWVYFVLAADLSMAIRCFCCASAPLVAGRASAARKQGPGMDEKPGGPRS